MAQHIAYAVTKEVERRNGTKHIVQEWPTFVALDAMDEIVSAYDKLKESGVIAMITNARVDIIPNEDGSTAQVANESQIDRFAGILRAIQEYRENLFRLLAKSVVTDKGEFDPDELKHWMIDELYDLVMAVYHVNFVDGSLKKVVAGMTNQTETMNSEESSESDSGSSASSTQSEESSAS